MPIGGAEDTQGDRRLLRRFVQLCGGEAARLVVIPSASGFPAETGQRYVSVFRDLGVGDVRVLHVDDRQAASDPAIIDVLNTATGIFMSGGDQLRLLTLMGGTPLALALQNCFRDGVQIAGTSAGASAMSRHMIAFGRSGAHPTQRMVQMASGLALTDVFIIDQHFTQRNRLGRLLTAVALNSGLIGMGIDEDTACIMYPYGVCEVIGSGTVTFVDGRQMTHNDIFAVKRSDRITLEGVQVQVLAPGQAFRVMLPVT